jgi:osmotically-inducible protein OsmY
LQQGDHNSKGENIMFKMNRLIKALVCCALISSSMGCAATTKHESTGQYVDDSAITTKVKAAIFDESSLKTLQINVKTYQGVVQLSGFVDSQQSVTRAGEVARQVKDVVSVENSLLVK